MATNKVTLSNGSLNFSAWASHPQAQLGDTSRYSRVVIFIHGFPDNNDSYHLVLPHVGDHYRGNDTLLVVPLLRGYEPLSQAPFLEYRMVDLAGDVKLWIQHLAPNRLVPVHLVGHDWGAIVAFKTASKYPDLVTSMVTMAIPYLTNLKPWELVWAAPSQAWLLSYMITMNIQPLYRWKFGNLKEEGYLDDLWRAWSPGWEYGGEIVLVRETLSQPGVIDHSTAYYRNLALKANFHERKWLVDFSKVPTLILGGDKDGCMAPGLFEYETQKLALVAKVKVQLLLGVGHFLHREDPRKVAELLCDWFEKYPTKSTKPVL